jgi:hypothetical protein
MTSDLPDVHEQMNYLFLLIFYGFFEGILTKCEIVYHYYNLWEILLSVTSPVSVYKDGTPCEGYESWEVKKNV